MAFGTSTFMKVQKDANQKQEDQGSVGLSNGTYAFDT